MKDHLNLLGAYRADGEFIPQPLGEVRRIREEGEESTVVLSLSDRVVLDEQAIQIGEVGRTRRQGVSVSHLCVSEILHPFLGLHTGFTE